MAEVLLLATSFPGVIFTVLFGVVLVYWAFVMVGVVDLGEGSDGALDGVIGAKGALEGSAKGLLEGSAKGLLEGAADAAGDGDFDIGDGGDLEPGPLAAIVSALKLRQVPATVVLSLMVIFSWLTCVVAMQAVGRMVPAMQGLVGWLMLIGAPILSLPLTMLAVQPLARVFVQKHAPSRSSLVGKTCVVRTGKVTGTFGEGTVEDGGAGLVVRLRVEGGKELKRGEAALIVDWDADREAFVVEPLDDVLGEKPRA